MSVESAELRATLSVRVEVDVIVNDEAELAKLCTSLAARAADACNTPWGSLRIVHAATVRRVSSNR